MKQFLIDNWKLVLEVAILILSVVFLCLKKKPVEVIDTIKGLILRLLPGCINSIEIHCSGLDSKEKKERCIDLLLSEMKDLGYDIALNKSYVQFIEQQIEVILSTPQKKVR